MKKKELIKCLKNQILTKKEYDSFFEGMSENENGELVGVMPNGSAYTKYSWFWTLTDEVIRDRVKLIEWIKYCLVPPLGVENQYSVFKKYGLTTGGICDGFRWKESINDAPIEDLFEMIMITERYWAVQYQRWYNDLKGL